MRNADSAELRRLGAESGDSHTSPFNKDETGAGPAVFALHNKVLCFYFSNRYRALYVDPPEA